MPEGASRQGAPGPLPPFLGLPPGAVERGCEGRSPLRTAAGRQGAPQRVHPPGRLNIGCRPGDLS